MADVCFLKGWEQRLKGYLSVKETAERWGVSVRWVNQYILEGRIPGCEKLGNAWAIPDGCVKPAKRTTGPKPKKNLTKRDRETDQVLF